VENLRKKMLTGDFLSAHDGSSSLLGVRKMFTVCIKIGACYMAHAEDVCKETAIRKSVELSRKIVNWKEGATPRFTIIYPNGKQFGRNVDV
jgi:hypothetical protein